MAITRSKREKVSLVLPHQLMTSIRQEAKKNNNMSLTAIFRQALEDYLKERERRAVYEDIRNAAKDPMFLADVQDTMNAYQHADGEGQCTGGQGIHS